MKKERLLMTGNRKQKTCKKHFLATRYSLLATLILIWFLLPQAVALAYTITATAGAGGSISPSGAVSVNDGADITFTITPDNGYVIANITIGGTGPVGAASTFTFYNVKNDGSITPSFLPEANSIAETIYVDNTLASDCLAGEYSVANRDNSGSDGNAYTSIIKAANIAGPGDTVYIRAGTYHSSGGLTENDALWPKHSGTAQNPITFKPYNDEQVIIGRGLSSWPNDNWMSIARGAITLRNVSHIKIEGLTFDYVAGWLFARDCNYITIENCTFKNALWGAKGGARLIECYHCRLTNNTFYESAYDALMLVMSDYNVVENNTFDTAGHSVLTLRSASYNVIRNNSFRNPRQKLIEVFDQKVDTRDPLNPSYIPVPGYNDTQHNLFENNTFGYHPYWDNRGAQPSAMQYSGQSSIIRNNVFSNPVLATPDPYYPGVAGGTAIILRWGGSWTGWVDSLQRIVGEGHEAGFVTHNRIYHNVFRGYDYGQVRTPIDGVMNGIPNPPPMKNVADYYNYPYSEQYAFEDNIFKNNAFSDTNIVPHISWTWLNMLAGKPVQVIIRGRLDVTYFNYNNFFASGQYSDQLLFDGVNHLYDDPSTPAYFNATYNTFSNNTQQDPLFVDVNNDDFQLQPDSPMIDAGGFLTKTTGAGSGTVMQVDDAGYFYDGYGIEGETGDVIQLEGQTETARIINIDYATNTLTLNQSLTWATGQGVSLVYSGTAPDIGAYEYVLFPVSVIQNEPKEGRAPLTVSFDGSQSRSPNGDIVSYEWDFGDGSTSTRMKTSHIFTSAGEYTVTLTVTDDHGWKGKSQTHIIVFEKEFGELPTGCYNNVFNPAKGEKALIVVELSEQARVKLGLYNTRGKRIRELVDEEKEAGTHKYYWDGKSDSGNMVGSGLYFVHIQAGDYKKTKKIVIIK